MSGEPSSEESFQRTSSYSWAHRYRSGDSLIDIRVLLEHLERFRWCFIKMAVAVVVGMVICLAMGNWIVLALKWPLGRAAERYGASTPMVYLTSTTNQLRRLPVPHGSAWSGLFGSEQSVRLQLQAVPYQTNIVLGFVAQPFKPGGLGQPTDVALNTYGPMGGFIVAFQVAFFGGLILALPFVLYFLAQFLMPILGRGGVMVKRALGPWVTTGVLLFLAGVLFCYFVLLPVSLYGSVGFARWMHFEANEWRAEAYIGFVCKFMIAMGAGFQLPVLILLLTNVGIVDHAKLTKFRPYWVVLDLIVSAFLTPDGSPVTMLLMAAPLLILYEISVLIVRGMERRRKADEIGFQ